jgi:catechol 2,3-dioxygenase-like lactoylglutathione lyase family enzyme
MSEIAELRVSLTVRDFDAAVALYRDALGLSVVADWDGPNGAGVVLAAGRATLEILDQQHAAYIDELERAGEPSGPVRLAMETSSAEDTARRLTGLADVGPPVDTPWGDRNVRVRPPKGPQLTLFTPSGKEDQWGK